jgi:very-short-patch-repair endonuclease
MVWSTVQSSEIWALVRRQHGVVSRAQLVAAGVSARGIEHRLAKGRLYLLRRGVYAVGRREVNQYGRWMAAVLACGPGAVLSHSSAAALWRIAPERPGEIEISVTAPRCPRRRGIRIHRRADLNAEDVTHLHGIPVTSPTRTLIDLSRRLGPRHLEAAVNDADKHDRIDPEQLRAELDDHSGEPGVVNLRRLLDEATFTLTDSELERRFLRIVKRAGLPRPLTQQRVNGYRVDFYWPDLALVVETDGLRYHRTPTQQARDRLRDQAHTAAGMTALRFTRAQVRYDAAQVEFILTATVNRLAEAVSRAP